jgi:hypothetical protein
MASYGFVVPVLPGMSERNREFAQELLGARRAEFERSRARHGIISEQVWTQETPQGTFSVVYLEAADIGQAFGGLAASDDPFDAWWRGEILAIHGVDLSRPLPGPPNEQVLDFHRT